MSKDPKSYRVPILRLKDVAKEDDPAPETDAEPPKKKKGLIGSIVAGAKKEVSEEDIAAAVITPVPTGGKKPPKEDIPTGAPQVPVEMTGETATPEAPAPEKEEMPKIKEDIPLGETSEPAPTADDEVITEQFVKEEEEKPAEEEVDLGIQIPEGSILSGTALEQKKEVPEQKSATEPEPEPIVVGLDKVPSTTPAETVPQPPIEPGVPEPILTPPAEELKPLVETVQPTEPVTEPTLPVGAVRDEFVPSPTLEVSDTETVKESTPITPSAEATVNAPSEEVPVTPPQKFEIKDEKSPIEDDTVDFGSSSTGEPLDIWEKAKKTVPEEEVDEKASTVLPTENAELEEKSDSTFQRVPEKAAGGGSNLASLRQKILNDTTKNTQGRQLSPPVGLGGTAPEPIKEEGRPRPDSKHASAIADVADKLSSISGTELGEEKGDSIEKKEGEFVPIPEKSAGERGDITEKPEVPASSVPLVRTFKADVESAIMKNQTSVVDMVSAQQNAKTIDETVKRAPRAQVSPFTVILMWGSAGLVLIAIAVATFALFGFLTGDRNTEKPEIVAPNESIPHDITNQSRIQILQSLTNVRQSNSSPLGTITELQIVESRGGGNGGVANTSIVSTYTFFERLNTNAPGSLIRATRNEMTIGLHKLVDNEVFWVFKVDDYQNASRGMFEWEARIFGDLTPLFLDNDATADDAASAREVKDFEDVTVANTAARGLRDSKGGYAMIWSMPDRETVVIASSFETMETLIKRMQLRAD